MLYLFWTFVALKFKASTFGDLDHFNGSDAVTQSMRENNRRELYKLILKDLELGQERRVSLIKYWTSKFQTHIFDARKRNSKLFTSQLQDILPFVIAKAIILGFED